MVDAPDPLGVRQPLRTFNARTDAAAASVLFERLEPYAALIVANGGACSGAVSHQLGLLATVLGRNEQAEAYFVDALQRHERLEAPFFTARTMLELARLFRADQPDRARELLDQAMELADTFGMARVRAGVTAARQHDAGRL